MSVPRRHFRPQLEQLLAEDYQLMQQHGLRLPRGAALLPLYVAWRCRRLPQRQAVLYLAAACQCLRLFGRCHRGQRAEQILLGDYFYSRFLELLLAGGLVQPLLHLFAQFSLRLQEQPRLRPAWLYFLRFVNRACRILLRQDLLQPTQSTQVRWEGEA